MKFNYLVTNFSYVANCSSSQESAAVGMEYLFMTIPSLHQRENARGNDNFIYTSFDVLNRKEKLEVMSGRYKKNVVPK